MEMHSHTKDNKTSNVVNGHYLMTNRECSSDSGFLSLASKESNSTEIGFNSKANLKSRTKPLFPKSENLSHSISNALFREINNTERNVSSLPMESLRISESVTERNTFTSAYTKKTKNDLSTTPLKGPMLVKRKPFSAYKTPVKYRKSYYSQHVPTIPLSISPMKKPLSSSANFGSAETQSSVHLSTSVETNVFFSSPDRFVLSFPPSMDKSKLPSPPDVDELDGETSTASSSVPSTSTVKNHCTVQRKKKTNPNSAPVTLRPRLRRFLRGKLLHEGLTFIPQEKQNQHPFSTPENGHSDIFYPMDLNQQANKVESIEQGSVAMHEDSSLKVTFCTPISSTKKKYVNGQQREKGHDNIHEFKNQHEKSQFATPLKESKVNLTQASSSASICTPLPSRSNDCPLERNPDAKRAGLHDLSSPLTKDMFSSNIISKAKKPQYDKHQLHLPVLAMP